MSHTERKEINMRETVREVNGVQIWKYRGTKGFYYITLNKTEKGEAMIEFKTIKAAQEYILRNC